MHIRILIFLLLSIATNGNSQPPNWWKHWYNIGYTPGRYDNRTQVLNTYEQQFNIKVACNGNSYVYSHNKTIPFLDSSYYTKDSFYYNPDIIIFSLDRNGEKRYLRHIYMDSFSVVTFDFKIDKNENCYFIGKVKADSVVVRNDSIIIQKSSFWHSYIISLDSTGKYRWSIFVKSDQDKKEIDNGFLAFDIDKSNSIVLFGYFKNKIKINNLEYTNSIAKGSNFILRLNENSTTKEFKNLNNLYIYNIDSSYYYYYSHYYVVLSKKSRDFFDFNNYNFSSLNDSLYCLSNEIGLFGSTKHEYCIDCNKDYNSGELIKPFALIVFNNAGEVKYKYEGKGDTIRSNLSYIRYYLDKNNNLYHLKINYEENIKKLKINLLKINSLNFSSKEILQMYVDIDTAILSKLGKIGNNVFFNMSIDKYENKYFFIQTQDNKPYSIHIKNNNVLQIDSTNDFGIFFVLDQNNKYIHINKNTYNLEQIEIFPINDDLFLSAQSSPIDGGDNIGFLNDSFNVITQRQNNLKVNLFHSIDLYLMSYKNPFLKDTLELYFCDSFLDFENNKYYSDTFYTKTLYNPSYPYCPSSIQYINIKKYNSPQLKKGTLFLDCNKPQVKISVYNPYANKYIWNTNDTISDIYIDKADTYSVSIHHKCGLFKDTFNIIDISKKYFDTINNFSCTSYFWIDSLYSKSNYYTKKYKSINQCDSFVTLNLKIGLNDKVLLQNGINYKAVQDSVFYQWYRCNPWRRISNETNQTFTTTTNGSYAVVLDNGKGCRDTSECIALNSSSTISLEERISKIYPNPFNNIVRMEFNKIYKEISIKIYDISGKLIDNLQLKNLNSYDLKLENFSKGNYYLQIDTESDSHFFNILKN